MKSKIIKNEAAQGRSAILSGNKEFNYITQYTDKKEYKPSKSQGDSSRINSNLFRNYNENTYENLFLKNLVDNLFDYIADQNSKEKLFGNKNDLYPMLGEKEKFLALENFDNTKSILLDNNGNGQNTILTNQNGGFSKKTNIANFKAECFQKSLNTNSNMNNSKDVNFKAFYDENSTEIFKIENDPNRKNSGLNPGFTSQSNSWGALNNHEILNNGKSKGKQTMINANNKDHGTNNNLNSSAAFPTNLNNMQKPDSTSKNFKLTISEENNKLCSNINNQFHLGKNNSIDNNIGDNNFNYFGLKEELNKKDELNLALSEEDKSIFMKTFKSPNPFEDYSFGQNSNLFNSPNPMEGIMYKLNEAQNEKVNFNFDLSRNSTLDYNDIFKPVTGAEHLEEKKLPKENNLFFDDSFFSISSNEKKSEAVTEPVSKNKTFAEAQVYPSSKSFN